MIEMLNNKVYFENVKDLVEYLRKEKEKPKRYAARFILVEAIDVWGDLIDRLSFEAENVVSLSSYCRNTDVFPDSSKVFESLNGRGPKDKETVLVLPVSEWMRIDFDRGRDFLARIVEAYSGEKKRIYVPLFRSRDMLENILSGFGRYHFDIFEDQVFYVGKRENKNCTLEIFSFDLERKDIEVVDGIRDYLSLWERGAKEHIGLHTEWAPYISDVFAVYNFDVAVYKCAYEWVCNYIRDLKKDWGDEKEWQWLANNISVYGDFTSICNKILNVASYDCNVLFLNWQEYKAHARWLTWLWCKREEKEGSYLYEVLKENDKLDNFEEGIILKIFAGVPSTEFCAQRKVLLTRLGIRAMPDYFWKEYELLDNPLAKLRVLTDLSERERENIVLCTGALLDNGEENDWQEYLKVIYPDLWNYLYGICLEDSFANAYFKAYNRCRIKDTPDDELIKLLDDWNEDRLWSYTLRREILDKERNLNTKVIWVDAMGIEWVGIFLHELQQAGLSVDVKVARSALPTITEINREWRENDETVLRELDKIAHDPNYRFPSYFLKSLDFIKNVVEKVKECIAVYPKVLVTSDHGLSRFALTSGQRVESNNVVQVERSGRYGIIESEDSLWYMDSEENKNFLIKEDSVIWLNYNRFKGSGISGGEVHGGAAPEECLVPVIIIERVAEKVNIKVLTNAVEFNIYRVGNVILEVDRFLPELVLKVKDKVFKGKREGSLRWIFELRDLENKSYKGELWEGNRKVGDVSFTVKYRTGIEQDDLGL